MICRDEFYDDLLFYSKNLTTHRASYFIVGFKVDFKYSVPNKGMIMRNFFLHVDTCDISCASCYGPTNVRTIILLVAIK